MKKKNRNILLFILGFYLILLGISWFIQIVFPAVDHQGKYEKSIELQISDQQLEITYHELGYNDAVEKPKLIILPDIYFRSKAVLPVAESLKDSFHIILPEVVEFQTGTTNERFTTDHKLKSLNQLFEELNVKDFHLMGHGYSGFLSIRAAEELDSIRSLTLLGSIGAQELRFLGNHHINRSLYSLARPIVSFYKYVFPHFGWYHSQKFSLEYIDATRYLDQRDFRETAKDIHAPVLILHDVNDQNVPQYTAKETHRVIPQSKLVLLDDIQNRDILTDEGWSEEISKFLNRVESGEGINRQEASEQRIQQSSEPFDSEDVESLSGKAFFTIFFLIMAMTIFSEDLSVIAAGLLAAAGIFPFMYAVLSCFLGILIIDTNIYWLGKKVGNPILKRVPFKWMIKEEDLNRAQNLYDMYGMELLFVARFIPGARFPTYFSAGLLNSKFKTFFTYFALSVAIWTPLLVGITVLIGQPMLQYLTVYQDYAIWILIVTILLIYLIFKVGIPLTTVRGRRRLLVKWSRFLQRFQRN
ncbi:VTT domain-containing protein [Rhodohalobacter sp.]|uniref:VTT domain-containing protein n=1 Tax=Rhodohalobacter sp. TaxID=1974210 RepID=UPI003562EE98